MNHAVKFIVPVFVASLCGNLAYAQFGRPADKPAPRTDRNSQIAHEQLLEKAGIRRRIDGCSGRPA